MDAVAIAIRLNDVAENRPETPVNELTEMNLALIGGGVGEVSPY